MAARRSDLPPGGGVFNPQLVKAEKSEAEKIHLMSETADTMKEMQGRLFPLNPPQKLSKLKAMFTAPNGVKPIRRNKNFFKFLITDIGAFEVKSRTSFGPSTALEKIWMKKDQIHQTSKSRQMYYAAENMLFVKVNGKLLLVFETAPFLKNSHENNMKMCLTTSRLRWFAANLMRFPTSPQILASQLVRNHARIYSEESNENTAVPQLYQNAMKRLIHFCTGMERALLPEGNMPIENHMRLSWFRIRKRVLERMYEEAQKVAPQSEQERKFLCHMPFGINTMADLLEQIKNQMEECDILWNREKEGEIELSDGPDMEEGEEDMDELDYSMRGQPQNEQRAASSHGQVQQRPQYNLLPDSSLVLPPAASRMNQLYNFGLEQKKKPTNTLASALGLQLAMRQPPTATFPHGGVETSRGMDGGKGRGTSLPQMTPTSSSGKEKIQMRRDQLVDTPSTLPSTSTTLTRRGGPLEREGAPQKPHPSPHQPPLTPQPSLYNSIPQPTQTHQPSLSRSTPQHQVATPSPPVPPPQQPTTPRVIPSSGETGHCGIPSVVQSSLFSSPQLMFMGTDGKLQPIPFIVYVERTENGLIQLSPPTPNPHLLMSIPSTGGSGRGSRRERSLSTGKRRVSLARQILKRRRTEYDGSSEASEEDEGKRQRAKERRKEYERMKKEEEKRIENEEREERERDDKEEEEFRKKEEEDKKKEEDGRKQKEEDNRKKKEEEDRKKKEEEDRKKKEEEERLEMERLRKEDELKIAMEREKMEEEERKEREEEEANEERVEEDVHGENDESGMEDGEEVKVLAKDSSDESENEEEGMESEDEIVAESVITQSENEEMRVEEEKEKENEKEIPSVSTPSEGGEGEKERGDGRTVEEGGEEEEVRASRVPLVPPADGGDSDIEVIFEGTGEKIPMSGEYCEVVGEVVKMKKELNETTNNDVIIIPQGRGKSAGTLSRSNQPLRGTKSDKRGPVDKSIRERTEKVKEENENEEREKNERDACQQPPPIVKREEEEERGDHSVNTGMAEVKSEVKEEETVDEHEEEREDEAMVTMIERRNEEEGERVEDTLNRSAELDFLTAGVDEEMERRRIVASAVSAIPPTEDPPVEKMTQAAATQAAPPIEKEKEKDVEMRRVEGAVTGDESAVRMSTPSARPPPISVSSQSETNGSGERMPRLQTRLSAQQIEMINTADSLCMPYEKGFQRRGLRETEKEKSKEDEKNEVEVIKELHSIETNSHSLKFHTMRGRSAVLSEDRRSAIRDEGIDSCSKALVFTNRPLFKGERVTLRVIETSAAWKGRIRLGLTTRDPLSYASRDDIPKFGEHSSDHEDIAYLYDSGAMNEVKIGSVLEVELTENGDVLNYWFDGVPMGAMGAGLQMARPMWLFLDIYGYVKGIHIVGSLFPPQETDEQSMTWMNMITKKEELSSQATEGLENEARETYPLPIEKEKNGEGMDEEDRVEEEEAEIEEGEKETEKRAREEGEETVDGKEMEEEGEPPVKKKKIEISDEAAKKKGQDIEKEALDTFEEEKKGIEEHAGESVEEKEKADGDQIVIPVDENGLKEMEEGGDNEEISKEKEMIESTEEEEMVEETEEEKEEDDAVIGVIEDGNEREEVVMEEDEVKEGETEESADATEGDQVSVVIEKSNEEEVKETEMDIPLESTEEKERMEIEDLPVPPVLPPRRRSLFGPGCLSIDRTLEARDTHGNGDEEEEKKMEVDEGVAAIRGRSLFGPGSISFDHLINEINDKP